MTDLPSAATYTIRPSSLPDFNDCDRRGAARSFRHLVEGAGYQLRHRTLHIGAAVGRAAHAGAAKTLQTKIDTGSLGNLPDAQEVAIVEFGANLEEEEVVWDDLTDGKNVGEKQLHRMVAAYQTGVAPNIDPVTVEERLEANLQHGFVLSGQKDVLVRQPDGIRDLKTGRLQRVNAAQYGAYAMIDAAHKRPIHSLIEDFVARTALSKPQKEAVSIEFNVEAAMWLAYDALQNIKRQVMLFEKRLEEGRQPPESAFRANPQSMLCSDKFCPAWGTDFCRVHKGAKL